MPFSPASLPIDTTVSYTAQGHTQQESSVQWTKDYGYNAAERLIRYQQTNQGQNTPHIQAQYRYDPFGRRISKTITQGGATKAVYFIYSEQWLMGETNDQGQLTKAYGFNSVAAQQGLWSTDPIWQADTHNGSLTDAQSQYHYLHTDHLGTPQLATTKEGQTSWKAQSEAFGAAGIIQSQSTIEMNLRFPGQYYDQETGTHYNFHRDYDPSTGRYLQSDPIGLDDGENYYLYAYGNSMSYIDWNGQWVAIARPVLQIIIGIIVRPKPRPIPRPAPKPVPVPPFPPVTTPPTAGGGTGSGSQVDPHDRPWRKRNTWHVYVSCHVKKKWDAKTARTLLVEMLMEAHLQRQMQERNQMQMQTFLSRP